MASQYKLLNPYIKISLLIIFLGMTSNYSIAGDVQPPNDTEKYQHIDSIENKLNDLALKFELLEEKESYFLVFDTYRIGLIGIILSCSGLIVALFIGLMSYKAYRSSQEVKQTEQEIRNIRINAENILSNMEKKRDDINNFINKLEKNMLLMIDQTLLSLAKLSEQKAELLNDLILPDRVKDLNDLRGFIINSLLSECDAFQKVFYKVNLFHPVKLKVTEALTIFSEIGKLEDIPTVSAAQKSMTEDNKKFAESVMRTIRKRST